MIIYPELWEAVWERSYGKIEVPDDEVGEGKEWETVTEWLYDHNEWLADATHSIEQTVDGIDYELTYKEDPQ